MYTTHLASTGDWEMIVIKMEICFNKGVVPVIWPLLQLYYIKRSAATSALNNYDRYYNECTTVVQTLMEAECLSSSLFSTLLTKPSKGVGLNFEWAKVLGLIVPNLSHLKTGGGGSSSSTKAHLLNTQPHPNSTMKKVESGILTHGHHSKKCK